MPDSSPPPPEQSVSVRSGPMTKSERNIYLTLTLVIQALLAVGLAFYILPPRLGERVSHRHGDRAHVRATAPQATVSSVCAARVPAHLGGVRISLALPRLGQGLLLPLLVVGRGAAHRLGLPAGDRRLCCALLAVSHQSPAARHAAVFRLFLRRALRRVPRRYLGDLRVRCRSIHDRQHAEHRDRRGRYHVRPDRRYDRGGHRRGHGLRIHPNRPLLVHRRRRDQVRPAEPEAL